MYGSNEGGNIAIYSPDSIGNYREIDSYDGNLRAYTYDKDGVFHCATIRRSDGYFVGNITGNSATATKLQTARTISLTGSVTGSGSFDGSGNLSITTSTNHTRNYLPLTDGTISGSLNNILNDTTFVAGASYASTAPASGISGTLSVSNGGTGKTTVQDAFSALSKITSGGYWSTAPTGISAWKYEGQDKTTYSIPTSTCFILVIKESNSRGTAIALEWASGGASIWKNTLHDDTASNSWRGWTTIMDSTKFYLSGTTLYINT